jgi:hypothetical protein
VAVVSWALRVDLVGAAFLAGCCPRPWGAALRVDPEAVAVEEARRGADRSMVPLPDAVLALKLVRLPRALLVS